jgi:hypothetical protein
MNIVVILLLLNIWPLHFAIASSLMITLLLLNFQLFTIEHIIIWQFNDATTIVFGKFFKLVQHFKDGYFEHFDNNSAQRHFNEKCKMKKATKKQQ